MHKSFVFFLAIILISLPIVSIAGAGPSPVEKLNLEVAEATSPATSLNPQSNHSPSALTLILPLAICLSFGFLGIHRVMLGANPMMIGVYALSFGGLLGFLPLMDAITYFRKPGYLKGNQKFMASLNLYA